MKVLKGADALPPLVDVAQTGNADYWVSPALPCLPVRDTRESDRFEAFALTALVTSGRSKKHKYVELRVVRIGMTLLHSGIAVPDGVSDSDDLHQTLAYGTMRLDKFLKLALAPIGRSVTSYQFSLYEDGIEMVTNTIAGGYLHEPQIIVNVCRGYDKPKKAEDRSHAYATIRFLFNEGAKSFRSYARSLARNYEDQ